MKALKSDTLVVDLDGTLLKSNMLFETFWSAFGQDWRVLFSCFLSICKGKAAFKKYLMIKSTIDETTLPYDDHVINLIKAYRAKGCRVALVTATNHNLACRISEHLKLFDEVYGSDESNNLKGKNKAKFLIKHFGSNKFIYVGDSFSDIAIWNNSKKIITVNASKRLKKKIEKIDKPFYHLNTSSQSILIYFKTMRLYQWVKNFLIFVPLITAYKLDFNLFMQSFHAFVAFCLVASSGYVFNDLLDLRVDRSHQDKCRRPFASGDISIVHGSFLILFLLIIGFLIAGFLSVAFFQTLLVYTLLTTFYSLIIKRKIILDIIVLAGLYTLRIIAGGAATSIPISMWLIAFSLFFFFGLAAVKRQAELVNLSKSNKTIAMGRGYTLEDLPIINIVSLCAGYLSVLVLALYINSIAALELFAQPEAIWGICCILLYWLTRIVLIAHRGFMHHDPILFALKDHVSQISLILIVGLFILGHYGC